MGYSNCTIEYITRGLLVLNPDNINIVGTLIKKTGGKISVVESPWDNLGNSLIIYGINDYEIFLSPVTTIFRDTFQMAHDLGHYCLHYHLAGKVGRVEFTRYGTTEMDIEANRFAASLLMPQDLFSKKFEQYQGNLSLLSGIYKLPQEVIRIRAESLRLM